ncbi:MAG: leucyl aminopeptidase [Spirochaetales bacterium]|nr:leucyl aminopeptidase [Spirochaetales bacterium]
MARRKNQSENQPLSLPENGYRFSAGRLEVEGHVATNVVLLFSDVTRDWSDRSGLSRRHCQELRERGLFRAAVAELRAENNVILLGLGQSATFHPEKLGSAMRRLGAWQKDVRGLALTIVLPETFEGPPSANVTEEEDESIDYESEKNPDFLIAQMVACFLIGAEKWEIFKKKKASTGELPHCPDVGVLFSMDGKRLKAALRHGEILGRMVNGVRYLAQLPGNSLTPERFEDYARSVAKEFKLKINVFQENELRKMGCGGIVAVGQGSAVPPRMIVLEYRPAGSKQKPVALVGKGITFDTGGISLKPPADMHEMKYDMTGAALVLHGVALAAARSLKQPVVAALGIAENMPDGRAIKPGDVYHAYNGLSIEIQNTDAEGRLVLGDVLAYTAKTYQPRAMLDFATLTGACVIALGHEAAALVTPSDALAAELLRAAVRSQDRLWRMPHWKEYGKDLKSDVADMRNIAGRPAGTLSAAQFLSRHVPRDVPWAHMDIAGTSWRPAAGGTQSKGSTGWGLRLLDRWLEGRP